MILLLLISLGRQKSFTAGDGGGQSSKERQKMRKDVRSILPKYNFPIIPQKS
jgi:hypothetical protein